MIIGPSMNQRQQESISKRIIFDEITPENNENVKSLYEYYEQIKSKPIKFEEIIDLVIEKLDQNDLYPTEYAISKIKHERVVKCFKDFEKNTCTSNIYFEEVYTKAKKLFHQKTGKIEERDLFDIFGFSIVDKKTLKPHSKTWEKSSSFPIDSEWNFVGFEMIDRKTLDQNKVVLFKETQTGFLGGYLKVSSIKEVTLPKFDMFSQPWEHKDIKVYNNTRLLRDINALLNERVTGLNESHLNIMKYIHSQKIPVFIVGGLIRDAIIGETSDIKDIDIGFG